MGFFTKIKEGLKKTKDNFSKKLYEVFQGRALDDEFYDELEMAMISSDMGVEASSTIIEELKDRAFREKIKNTEDAKTLLKEIMVENIDYDIPEYEYPLVIMVAGVNGEIGRASCRERV